MAREIADRFYCLAAALLLLTTASLWAESTKVFSCVEGDSLRISSVDFQGLKTTSASIISREIKNKKGSHFTCAKWEAERTRLLDLDIFADVELKTSVRDSSISLVYFFRELPPYIPFIAISKTEQDGLSLGPALASLNFLGQGIRAEFISRFGGTTEAQASLSARQLAGLPVEYDLAVLRVNSFNSFGNFHEDSWRAKLDLVHHLGGAINFLYAGEVFYLKTRGAAKDRVLLNPEGDLVPRLGGGFLWDSRDRHHDPRHGLYQELRLTQNGGWLGGAADYTEWLSDTRAYLPWLKRNTLQVASLYQFRTGTLEGTFGRYDLFHVGGINTLRGYDHDAFQGKSEILLTLENRTDLMQKRILRLWRWSAYYGLQGIFGVEAASLWNHDALLEGDLHSSLYTGVHLLIAGVDRIRLECGSNFAKFAVKMDLGIFDKSEIQRFRAR